jgi:HAD superfamily hydrolase (TIGR01509 family)
MSIEAVIFDCDGTLVDSETLASEVLVECVRPHGLELTVGEALTQFAGRKMAECVAELEQRLGKALPPDFVPGLRTRMADAFRSRLQLVEGALSVVQYLEVPYCVASSGPREKIELSLGITGLLPYFEGRIFSAYEVGSWKPDPGLFLHAAKALGVAPERCAVVEDSAPGLQAGLAAGMVVFAFRHRGAIAGDTADGVRVLRQLRDLPDLLVGRCPA